LKLKPNQSLERSSRMHDGSDNSLACGSRIESRLQLLEQFSAEKGALARFPLSPELAAANALVRDWMQDAGMTVWQDAGANIIGRYEGHRASLPALVLGSHLDTVRDAGRYDGMLGVVAAIECVDQLNRQGARFPFAIEVIGFCDEEGVRFGTSIVGSRVVAGSFDAAELLRADENGVLALQALTASGLDADRMQTAVRRPDEILAYVELHIEQGPVLERLGHGLGCVSGIVGASKLEIVLRGEAGHAGTVPMQGRRDALVAASECILGIEAIAAKTGAVATVGYVDVEPGSSNVIPGKTSFAVDIRSLDDEVRRNTVVLIRECVAEICAHRKVEPEFTLAQRQTTPCSEWLQNQIVEAIDRVQGACPVLPSGAGHDGIWMSKVSDIGMIFVRCAGGISHNPAESVSVEDLEGCAQALLQFIANFEPPGKAA